MFASDQIVASASIVLDLLRTAAARCTAICSLGAVFEQELEQPVERQARVWIGAGADRGAVDRERERGRRVEPVDPEDLALLKLERVVDDEVAEPVDAWVGHACLIPD